MLTLLALLLAPHGFAAAPAPSASQLLANWRNAIYADREHSRLELSLKEAKGTPLVRKAEVWYKAKAGGASQILIKFNEPSTIRGVAFLSLRGKGQGTSDQWIYFPAYKKARRLSSQNRDESFLDSDFTNGDITFDYEDAFDFKVTGSEKVQGRDTYKVEGKIKPARAEGFAYAREVLYITKDNFLNLRTEFFDDKNKLVKSLRVETWKQYQNRWTADKIVVENELTHHQSTLNFTARDFGEAPADRLFTLGNLENGR